MTDLEACWTPCEHGGACTLPTDHDGDHEAWGTKKMWCTWPRAEGERREGLIEGVTRAIGSILGDL